MGRRLYMRFLVSKLYRDCYYHIIIINRINKYASMINQLKENWKTIVTKPITQTHIDGTVCHLNLDQ